VIYKIRIGPARIHVIADAPPHDVEDTWSVYWSFQYQGDDEPDLRIHVRLDAPPSARAPHLVGEVSSHWRLFEESDHFRMEIIEQVSLKPRHIVLFSKSWDDAMVHVMRPDPQASERMRSGWVLCDLMEPLVQWWLSSWLALRDIGVVLHASGVSVDGRGLAFIGESGAGKTTLARICAQEGIAKVLNDERIVLWREGSRWRVGGTPWHGELVQASPEAASLGHVCLLKKASEEHFVLRSGAGFMLDIVSQAFLPVWSREAMDRCMGLIDGLLQEVPSGELRFRRDPQVARFIKGLASPVGVA